MLPRMSSNLLRLVVLLIISAGISLNENGASSYYG